MGNANDVQTRKSGPFKLSAQPLVGGPAEEEEAPSAPSTAVAPPPPPPSVPEFEDLGELPTTYGEDQIFLTARDPHWLFCYWDFDPTRHRPARLIEGVPRFTLKIITADGNK